MIDISEYALLVLNPIAVVVACIMVIRTLRIFPTFVKTGNCGDMHNMIVGDGFTWKAYLTETHPVPIFFDAFISGLILMMSFLFFSKIPYILAVSLVAFVVYKFAQYSRNRFVKKQEFHEKLKGE